MCLLFRAALVVARCSMGFRFAVSRIYLLMGEYEVVMHPEYEAYTERIGRTMPLVSCIMQAQLGFGLLIVVPL